MKRVISSLLCLFLLILSINCSKKKSETEAATIPVKVTSVTLGDLVQSLSYSGDINAEFEVKVFSKVPDRIEKFYVDEGSRVEKGQPIAKIYAMTIEQMARQAEAGLAAAQAQAANAQVEYDRANRLYKENAMSKQQYDLVQTQYEAANAGLEQAQAALKSAKSQLTDATVTAPISGFIGKRYYEEGDMANPAMPLVTVVQTRKVKTAFNVTEVDLGRMAVGQTARVKVKSYPDKIFTGKVTKISPVLDPLTRMADVEVMIDNYDSKLKPGMFAEVEVIVGRLKNVIVVPRYAVIENTVLETVNGDDQVVKNYFVYVAQDSTAKQCKLDVEYVNHVNVAVRSGITTGEKLVVEGQNNLRDGSAIKIIGEDQQL
jgi:RND family efflux transporter MFP subunit